MAELEQEVLDAIAEYIDRALQRTPSDFIQATYLGPEEVDEDLSMIQLPNGNIHRGVRKHAHVTDLVIGETIECKGVRSAESVLCIVGRIAGDVTKYTLE